MTITTRSATEPPRAREGWANTLNRLGPWGVHFATPEALSKSRRFLGRILVGGIVAAVFAVVGSNLPSSSPEGAVAIFATAIGMSQLGWYLVELVLLFWEESHEGRLIYDWYGTEVGTGT